MKINKAWHLAHPMPKNPSMDERIDWHMQHARQCACREMPKSILDEIRKRSGAKKQH